MTIKTYKNQQIPLKDWGFEDSKFKKKKQFPVIFRAPALQVCWAFPPLALGDFMAGLRGFHEIS